MKFHSLSWLLTATLYHVGGHLAKIIEMLKKILDMKLWDALAFFGTQPGMSIGSFGDLI